MTAIITILLIISAIIFLWPRKKSLTVYQTFPEAWEKILKDKVPFYKGFTEEERKRFKKRVLEFLNQTRITGVETEIDDTIRLFVASSAIIPVFNFEEWEYFNLSEVLVYNGLVETYQIEETDRKNKILGQVRPFQTRHLLLLSKQSLEKAFENMNGKENVGFHEFAHLLDEADGTIDGVPKSFLPNELLQPWTHLMYKELEKMKKGKSDINPYGLTNHAEFFAVVCEYFFENPQKFKSSHPELFEILSRTFKKRNKTL